MQVHQASGYEIIPEQEVFAFISLANPVDVSLHDNSNSVSLHQAKQGFWIIFLTRSGLPFCITCPCSKILVPTSLTNTLAPTYQLVPSYVGVDKVIGHFDRAHWERHPDLQQLELEHVQQSTVGVDFTAAEILTNLGSSRKWLSC